MCVENKAGEKASSTTGMHDQHVHPVVNFPHVDSLIGLFTKHVDLSVNNTYHGKSIYFL